jgi:hypothetical protein
MAQKKEYATRAQVKCEEGARSLLRALTKLDPEGRKKFLNGIHGFIPRRTLPTLESGSRSDCIKYVISLMRVYGGAQFLHALVAFDRKLSAVRKQNAGINALARACLEVKK